MEEKIKISIPLSTYNIIIKDAKNFGFYKNELEVNKNLFFNTLITNYYEIFSNDENVFQNELKKAIENIPNKNIDDTLDQILKIINKRVNKKNSDSKTVTTSFKPTKLSYKTIDYINNILIKNDTISSYYRKLLNSYAHTPQNERELIIFKESYNTIKKSIKDNVKVNIFLKNGAIYKDLSIYSISSSIDELFNYVLCVDNKNNPHTIRIAKIDNITLSTSKREISDRIKTLFDRQIKHGPQYPIFNDETNEIIIKLTDKGKELYKKIYLYRPEVDSIEGDYYHFSCSYNQVLHYFKRFGEEAIILSPKRLTIGMKTYYTHASKAYKEILNSME